MNQSITLSGNAHDFPVPPSLPDYTNMENDTLNEFKVMVEQAIDFEINMVNAASTAFNVSQAVQIGLGAIKAGTQLSRGNIVGAGATFIKEGLKYGAGELVESIIMGELQAKEKAELALLAKNQSSPVLTPSLM